MDAEFFCLDIHQTMLGRLNRLLDRYVDPSIALKMVNTEASPDRGEMGRRFSMLLHASIPPERELTIDAVTAMNLFGIGIYLRIYWPLQVEQYRWSSLYDDYVYETARTTQGENFHGGGRGLQFFLPSLAIRNQMVLVPKGQGERLEDLGRVSPDRPPPQRGVIEVDFSDDDEVEAAFVTIGKELRAQLRQELVAYRSFDLDVQADFDAIAAHLGVSPRFLDRAVREEAEAKDLIFKQLTGGFSPTQIVKDVQTRLTLTVANPSSVDLDQVRIQLRGPSSGMEIVPERAAVQIGAQSTVSVDFSVAASRLGDYVIEILFLDADADLRRELLPVLQLWITSVAE